jgi:hypothetical protein
MIKISKSTLNDKKMKININIFDIFTDLEDWNKKNGGGGYT